MKPLLAVALFLTLDTALCAEPPEGYVLKWSDEFDGTRLDPAKWRHWNPGKRRQAINTPDAVTVADGKLTITTYTEGGKHYTALYLAGMHKARCSGVSGNGRMETPSGGRKRLRARRGSSPAVTLFVRSVPRLLCPHRNRAERDSRKAQPFARRAAPAGAGKVSEAAVALPLRRACIDKVGRGHWQEVGIPMGQSQQQNP